MDEEPYFEATILSLSNDGNLIQSPMEHFSSAISNLLRNITV